MMLFHGFDVGAPARGGQAWLARDGEAQLARFAFAQPLEEMAAAQGDIAVVAADLGLRAGGDRMAVGIDAQVHRRLAPAFAHRFQLDQRIGEREQRRASPGKASPWKSVRSP